MASMRNVENLPKASPCLSKVGGARDLQPLPNHARIEGNADGRGEQGNRNTHLDCAVPAVRINVQGPLNPTRHYYRQNGRRKAKRCENEISSKPQRSSHEAPPLRTDNAQSYRQAQAANAVRR
jgi:hypothetical protein